LERNTMPETNESDSSSRDFFSAGVFATLAGATAAVVIVANTIIGVVGESRTAELYVPLVLAFACSVGAYAYAVHKKSKSLLSTPRGLRYALVVLNCCLIYTSAFGLQSVALSETVEEDDAAGTEAVAPASAPVRAHATAAHPGVVLVQQTVGLPRHPDRSKPEKRRYTVSSWISVLSSGVSKDKQLRPPAHDRPAQPTR
jgi:hypothetical protein